MKAVVYVRVSSAEQVDNTSLATQEEDCYRWCESRELEIDRVFVERGESASTADRTEFQKMYRYLETVRGHVSHLVVWRFDRLFRNTADAGEFRRKLKALGVRDVSVTQPTDDSSSGDFMKDLTAAFDAYDNKTKSERSMRSMVATYEGGRWCWPTPIGYLTERSSKTIVPDPVRGPFIAQLFDLISSGQVKKTSALAQLTRMGLRTKKGHPLTAQTVQRMLKNELYCGRMVSKKWVRRVKGDFTPLISEELFDAVQAILNGRSVAAVPHKRLHEDFPLKGTLRCPVCNHAVTGSISAGKMAARFHKKDAEREQYLYKNYRCYKVAGHFSLRAELAEAALEELLARMQPEARRMDAVTALFRKVWTERNAVAMTELEAMQKQLRKLEAKEMRLVDSLGEGVLNNDAFKRAAEPLAEEMNALRQGLAHRQFEQLDIEDAVSYLQSMCWNLATLWQHNDLEKRSSFLRLLFPDGITYRGNSLEPISTNSFFTYLWTDNVSEDSMASQMNASWNTLIDQLKAFSRIQPQERNGGTTRAN